MDPFETTLLLPFDARFANAWIEPLLLLFPFRFQRWVVELVDLLRAHAKDGQAGVGSVHGHAGAGERSQNRVPDVVLPWRHNGSQPRHIRVIHPDTRGAQNASIAEDVHAHLVGA